MKVIFVSVQENTDIIGVKYLHAYLTSKGYESAILLIPDSMPNNVKAAINYILGQKPDVLCLSAMSYEFERMRNFASMLKVALPRSTIIFGGIHATSDPESCLEVSDIVVRGEGEDILLELIRSLEDGTIDSINNIKGIVYKDGDKIVHTSIRKPLQLLNILPFPKHLPDYMYVVYRGGVHSVKEKIIYKRYGRYQGSFLSILSSRGCPFSCRYCCNSLFRSLYGESGIRKRSAESVIDEINSDLHDFKGILYVNFQDDCFLMHSLDWIIKFSKLYSKEIGIPFVVRCTPKQMYTEKIVLLKEAGLRWVFMGLQSGSDRINKEIYGRIVTSEEFIDAARTISKLGLSPCYDVILDNPYETETDRLQTIDVLLRTPRPFQLNLFSLDYFPGTELFYKAIKDGIQVPQLGTKLYTKLKPTLMNYFVRMSAVLPIKFVRLLVAMRRNTAGRLIGLFSYWLTFFLEPFAYLRLIFRSNDYKIMRTLKVANAFYIGAIEKLFLRK